MRLSALGQLNVLGVNKALTIIAALSMHCISAGNAGDGMQPLMCLRGAALQSLVLFPWSTQSEPESRPDTIFGGQLNSMGYVNESLRLFDLYMHGTVG